MKFSMVMAVRFMSLGCAIFDLDREGVTLVEGINNDSPAESNGAGKSSLFEAINWCLFGSTRRGLKGDEIVNRHEKGGAAVLLRFIVKGVVYSVIRTRRFSPMGTGLFFYRGEAVLGDDGTVMLPEGAVEITKGTMKDTQAHIEEVMGFGQLAFQKSVYFGQGDVKPFASLTDGELKQVFEQALGLSQLSEDAAKMAGFCKAKANTINGIQIQLDAEKANLNRFNEEMSSLVKAKDEFEADKTAKLNGLKDLEREKVRQIEACDNVISEQLAIIEAEKAKVPGLEEQLAKMTELKVRLEAMATNENNTVVRTKERFVTAYNEVNEIKAAIERTKSREGQDCEMCGVSMSGEALATTMKRLEKRMANMVDTLKTSKGAFDGATSEKKKIDTMYTELTDKLGTIQEACRAATTAISNAEGQVDTQNILKVSAMKELERVRADIKAVKASTNAEIEGRIETLVRNIKKAQEIIEDLEASRTGEAYEMDLATEVKDALGNAGLKSLVFDKVTPNLNRYANEYVAHLDPGTSIELSTVTKLKSSGELREKFAVNVETEKGAAVFNGHSGGERQMVNLAISLAFNRMMREMSGAVPDILVLDEPFESLDSGSSEAVMSLLGKLCAGNVFLVSHNQAIKDLVPNRVKVTKTDGIATVEG